VTRSVLLAAVEVFAELPGNKGARFGVPGATSG
jgi:hypothetical protein